MAGLESLRTPDEVAKLRGLSINEVLGLTGESRDGSATPANGKGNGGGEAAATEEAPAAAAEEASA
jgi:small subunit ribosomal protein S5